MARILPEESYPRVRDVTFRNTLDLRGQGVPLRALARELGLSVRFRASRQPFLDDR